MKNIKRKIKIAAALLIIIFIVATIFYFIQKKKSPQAPLSIKESVPTQGATEVSVFNPLTITFNQTLNSSTIYVSSEPSEVWSLSQTTPDTIKLDHAQYLRVTTAYKLTILQKGVLVGTLSFKTSPEQNDPRFLQNLQSELDTNYPLVSKTPYETPNYSVVYIAPLTLEIRLQGHITEQNAISQVQLWVRSQRIDPATHKYIVITPPPQP